MASGDTKTNQYLDIAANGTRADLPTDTCCETRTQSLIRGVAERVIGVEEEVERLENNPDVVDIVATYADLQNYDTSGLTDKDIIRVLEDSTHNNNSTYYRWNAATNQFDFVGEIGGGENDGARILKQSDYNWPADNPDGVALWLMPVGLYSASNEEPVKAYITSTFSYTANATNFAVMVAHKENGVELFQWHTSGSDSSLYADIYIVRTGTGVQVYRYPLRAGIINNLTSTSTTIPLAAAQGKALNDKITIIEGQLTGLESALNAINNGTGA